MGNFLPKDSPQKMRIFPFSDAFQGWMDRNEESHHICGPVCRLHGSSCCSVGRRRSAALRQCNRKKTSIGKSKEDGGCLTGSDRLGNGEIDGNK